MKVTRNMGEWIIGAVSTDQMFFGLFASSHC